MGETRNTAGARARAYLALMDLTSLSGEETHDEVIKLCEKALSPVPVAAVCVYPNWVSLTKERLSVGGSAAPRVATVVNFPSGCEEAEVWKCEIAKAKADGADEIDFVIPWQEFTNSRSEDELLAYLRLIVAECRPCTTKAILETSQLTGELIAAAARACVSANVNFIKTSTGKVGGGATEEALRIIAATLKSEGGEMSGVASPTSGASLPGIKASGGIKTFQQCDALVNVLREALGPDFVNSSTLRIGASSLRDSLIERMHASD